MVASLMDGNVRSSLPASMTSPRPRGPHSLSHSLFDSSLDPTRPLKSPKKMYGSFLGMSSKAFWRSASNSSFSSLSASKIGA